MPLEHGQGLVHGVALGNSAQVDPHALLEQFDRLVPGVQPDQLVTHQVSRLPQGLGRGKLLLPPCPPPEPHHRPDGHVEGPAALLGNLLGMFQDLPQFGADRDGLPLARGIAEPPQFALRIVIAEDAVQGVDPGKSIFGRRSCGLVRSAEYNTILTVTAISIWVNSKRRSAPVRRRRGRHSHPQQPHPNHSAQQSHFPPTRAGRGSPDFSLFHSSTFEVSMIRLLSIRSLRESVFWILALVGIVAGMYLRTAAAADKAAAASPSTKPRRRKKSPVFKSGLPSSAELEQIAEAKAKLLARPTPEWLPKPVIDIPEAKASDAAGMKAYVEQVPGTDAKFKMVPIPGGKFLMGSPATEKGHQADEGPQHEVAIEPFWMEEHEVTWAEYELWSLDLDKQRRKFNKIETTDRDKLVDAVAVPTNPYQDMSFGMGKEGTPAICMTQFAAKVYCRWLSAKTGRYYRLPTEAEWEYACRAGTRHGLQLRRRPGQARRLRLVRRQQRRQVPSRGHEEAQSLGPVRHARQRLGVGHRPVRGRLLRQDRREGRPRTRWSPDTKEYRPRGPRRLLGRRRRQVPLGDAAGLGKGLEEARPADSPEHLVPDRRHVRRLPRDPAAAGADGRRGEEI